jgi:adenosylcobinamide kinase/adenosylcobinamide-phosphate guanylyltransferase
MSVSRVVLVGGGVRSGKSGFAESLACSMGARRVFVATAEALDSEMHERIARHRRERGDAFRTVEAPLALPETIAGMTEADVVLIDCLTLWLSNLLVRGEGAELVLERVDALCAALRRSTFHCVVVTNEVGMGIVPETPLGRIFRDLAGFAHQRLAVVADEIYLAVVGVVLRVSPAPIEVRARGGRRVELT